MDLQEQIELSRRLVNRGKALGYARGYQHGRKQGLTEGLEEALLQYKRMSLEEFDQWVAGALDVIALEREHDEAA
jgi:flagellar biosynthesis/type III secretory pathway protein FliH